MQVAKMDSEHTWHLLVTNWYMYHTKVINAIIGTIKGALSLWWLNYPWLRKCVLLIAIAKTNCCFSEQLGCCGCVTILPMLIQRMQYSSSI